MSLIRNPFSSQLTIHNSQKDAEIVALKIQLKEVQSNNTDLSEKVTKLTEDNERLEKSNAILDESVKVAQGNAW